MQLSAKLKSPKSPESLRVLISNCGLLPLTSASLCPQKSWSVPAPISQTSTCDAMELCGEHFLLRSRYKYYKRFWNSAVSLFNLYEINLPIHKCLIQQTRLWTIPISAGRGKLSAILSPKPQVPGRTVCCMKKVFTRRLGCKLTFNLKCINWHSQVSNAGACLTATRGAYRVGEGCRAEDGQAAIAQKKEEMMKSSSTNSCCQQDHNTYVITNFDTPLRLELLQSESEFLTFGPSCKDPWKFCLHLKGSLCISCPALPPPPRWTRRTRHWSSTEIVSCFCTKLTARFFVVVGLVQLK